MKHKNTSIELIRQGLSNCHVIDVIEDGEKASIWVIFWDMPHWEYLLEFSKTEYSEYWEDEPLYNGGDIVLALREGVMFSVKNTMVNKVTEMLHKKIKNTICYVNAAISIVSQRETPNVQVKLANDISLAHLNAIKEQLTK